MAMCLSGCASTTPAPSVQPSVQPSAGVTIKNFAFTPGEVTIVKGGSVTWSNVDGTTHTVAFADNSSPDLGNGATYSKTFDETGTFSYKCSIHPGMTGKVIVV
jgi:plastocyanin